MVLWRAASAVRLSTIISAIWLCGNISLPPSVLAVRS
jgi:hypothetical protein